MNRVDKVKRVTAVLLPMAQSIGQQITLLAVIRTTDRLKMIDG